MIITILGGDDSTEVGLGQWMLSDANGDNQFTFNIGPSDGDAIVQNRNIVYSNESGSDSTVRTIMFEQANGIPTLEITGTLLSLTQLGYLKFFAQRSVPLLLTDDLGRSIQVYVTTLDPKRRRSVSHREIHDYTMSFMVLDDLLDGAFWADYV